MLLRRFLRNLLTLGACSAALGTLPAAAAAPETDLNSAAFLSAAAAELGLESDSAKSAVLSAHLKQLAALTDISGILQQALERSREAAQGTAEDSTAPVDAEAERRQLYQLTSGSALPQVRAGMLRLSAAERKRLFIYDLSKLNFMDDEGCSTYVSGSALLSPDVYQQGARPFFASLSAAELEDYLGLIAKALSSELSGTPEAQTLSADELLKGRAAFDAALDFYLSEHPEERAALAPALLKPQEATAAQRCYTQKSLLLILLTIKGEPGDLALLSALQLPQAAEADKAQE